MKVNNLRSEDRTYFMTRTSIYVPILFITQMNIGIFMIYVGPYMNRLFDIRASVMMMRQALSAILLFIFMMATKKLNLA